MYTRLLFALTISATLFVIRPAMAETWAAAQPITPPNHEAKDFGIAGARSGGIHFTYRNAQTSIIYYRRYRRDTGWGDLRQVKSGNFVANTRVTESNAQEVWVAWENWLDGPNAYAARSTNGGLSWTEYDTTNYPSAAGVKHPWITPLGNVQDSYQVMVSAWDTKSKEMIYNVWDGFRWLGRRSLTGPLNSSEYWVTGGAYSPFNGGVYRQYGISNDLHVNFYDPNTNSWAGHTRITFTNTFFAWADVACDSQGKVMVLYERNERVLAVLFRPSTGWETPVDLGRGRLSSVTAISNKEEFYCTWLALPEQNRIIGRHWIGGVWEPPVVVTQGVPWAFSNQNEVTSDPWGTVYCVFEYWGSGGPVDHFTYTRDFEYAVPPTPGSTPPPPPTSTVTSTFTVTPTFTVTLTPTVTNTPRPQSPTRTPTPTNVPVWPNLLTW